MRNKTPTFLICFFVLLSVAVRADNYLSNSPFRISSGSWCVVTDTIDGETIKAIECITAGVVYVDAALFQVSPTLAAYGTWEWWAYKSGATVMNVGFINPTTVVGGGGDYYLAWAADETSLIWETAVGTVLIGPSISHSTWTNIKITRSSTGAFELFVDGVLGGTGTDTTITASSYWVFDMKSGDKISISDRSGNYSITKSHGVVAP